MGYYLLLQKDYLLILSDLLSESRELSGEICFIVKGEDYFLWVELYHVFTGVTGPDRR